MRASKGTVIRVQADGAARVRIGEGGPEQGCTSGSERCHCAEEEAGLILKAENRAGAGVGDSVSVLFQPGAVMKSLLVLIGIPSLGILAGLIAGTALRAQPGLSPSHAFWAGAACFFFSVIGAALVYRGIASQLKPVVDRILSSGGGPKALFGIDPVCGRDVEATGAAAKIEFAGRTYSFCGAGCVDAFVKDPQRYAGAPCCADGQGSGSLCKKHAS